SPRLIITLTVLAPKLATARSILPSPSRSTPATAWGVAPVGTLGSPGRPTTPPHTGGTHVPPTQTSAPGHTTGFAPTQVPLWQVSVWVQALPSLQAVPFGMFPQMPSAARPVRAFVQA